MTNYCQNFDKFKRCFYTDDNNEKLINAEAMHKVLDQYNSLFEVDEIIDKTESYCNKFNKSKELLNQNLNKILLRIDELNVRKSFIENDICDTQKYLDNFNEILTKTKNIVNNERNVILDHFNQKMKMEKLGS